jgi:hypothetical protein
MKKTILERWAKTESEIPVHEETLAYSINGKLHEYDLIHNFNMLNLDIDKAFIEWAKQTSSHNILDFCHFVMSQSTDEIKLICFPKQAWSEFQREQELNTRKKH